MAITQIIAPLSAVLNDSETFYEDIAVRNNSLVTVSFPSINTWATQANALAVEVNDKAAQVAAQAVDGGYSQDYINDNFFSQDYINDNFFSQNYINDNFIGVNNAQDITEVKTFIASPIVPTPTTGTQAVNKDYVDNKSTLPIGAILNGYTIFDNCIVAFGGEFNRADYPKLWVYLQANPTLVKTQANWQTEATLNDGICGFFSDGNGTTTFRVPNLDKAFLRLDSRGIGSFQKGTLVHAVNGGGDTGALDGIRVALAKTQEGFRETMGYDPLEMSRYTDTYNSGGGSSNKADTAPNNFGATRPKNIAVLPLIVAK